MKTRIVLTTLLALIVIVANSQTNYREPEYSESGYGYGKSEFELEKKPIYLQEKADAAQLLVGVGKTNKIAFVEGKQSPVRFSSSDTIRLVINSGDNKLNPKDFLGIAKMQINQKKGRRFVVYGQSFAGIQNNSKNQVEGMVEYQGKKFGQSSYLITVYPLAAGEYGIGIRKDATTTATHLLLFGVD
jgi:hypothetical protein